jgi:DNA-binding response OmpR family regulator
MDKNLLRGCLSASPRASITRSSPVRHISFTGRGDQFATFVDVPQTSNATKRVRMIGNVEIRPAEFQVLIEERRVGLTVREFELFMLLAERLDAVVQRPEIYSLMWGGEMPRRDRSVDVLIRRVRAKLEQVAPEWRYIHTHFGIGYRFSPEPAP